MDDLKPIRLRSALNQQILKFVNKEDFSSIHENILNRDADNKKIFVDLYFYNDLNSEIKELIASLYSEEISQREEAIRRQQKVDAQGRQQGQEALCSRWDDLLQPEPEIYSPQVFSFFVRNKDKLSACQNYFEKKQRTIDLASDIIGSCNPLKGTLENTQNGFRLTEYCMLFPDCIELLAEEDVHLGQESVDNVFRFLPFAYERWRESFSKIAKDPSKKAIEDVLKVYSGDRQDDLAKFQPSNLLEVYKIRGFKEAEPVLIKIMEDSETEPWVRKSVLETLPGERLGREKLHGYLEKENPDSSFYEILLGFLITEYNDDRAIELGIKKLDSEFDGLEETSDTDLRYGSNFPIAEALVRSDYSVDRDIVFLEKSIAVAREGKKQVASFIQNFVSRHVDRLKHEKTFEPLIALEKFVENNKDAPSMNWFEYELARLKETYLKHISTPEKIIASTRKYNTLKEKDYLFIPDSRALAETVKSVVDVDLRQWVEFEGAYKYINELSKKRQNRNAEDFIQKTVKSQIELALLKKGLRETDYKTPLIKREEQLLDDKRIDFTISYGFVGTVLLELKLANNDEARPSTQKAKDYVYKLKESYIQGTVADYAIFLIFNTTVEDQDLFERQIQDLKELYVNETNISIIGLNCI